MTPDELMTAAFRWSEELRKAINGGDRDAAMSTFTAAAASVTPSESAALLSVMLGELIQLVHEGRVAASHIDREPSASRLLDDCAVLGRSDAFFSEVLKFVVQADAGDLVRELDALIDSAIGGELADRSGPPPGTPSIEDLAGAREPLPHNENGIHEMRDLSGEWWFVGNGVYTTSLRSYGGNALPEETDERTRYAADTMCLIAHGVRQHIFGLRKGGRLFPGVGGFGRETVEELTATAVSVAIPAVVDWTGFSSLCDGSTGDYFRRRLRTVLPGSEQTVDALGRERVLDLSAAFATAARLIVAVAARHGVKMRADEKQIATVELPLAVMGTRQGMETALRGLTLVQLLQPLVPASSPSNEHPNPALDDDASARNPFGLSSRAYQRLTDFPFAAQDRAGRTRELDALVSSDGFDAAWHEMTVAQVAAALIGRSTGHDCPDHVLLELSGAFVAGARLGEVVFGVKLPLGEPHASGDFVTQAQMLIPSSPRAVMDFVQHHLPQPMTDWLAAVLLGDLQARLAPLSEDASYATMATSLAGLRWVAQAA